MRHLLVDLIAENPPSKPACFETHEQWVSWLSTAHLSGERIVRRVDVGRTRADRRAGRPGNRQTHFVVLPLDQIDLCGDCTMLRRQRMDREGRCCPTVASQRSESVPRTAAAEVA